MREVAVHLDDEIGAAGEDVTEPVTVGGAETLPFGAVKNSYTGIARRGLVGNAASAVG